MRNNADWVIVKFIDSVHDGRMTIWRDHGTAWGSPQYTVLGYFSGTYQGARHKAKRLLKGIK